MPVENKWHAIDYIDIGVGWGGMIRAFLYLLGTFPVEDSIVVL